MDRASEIGGFFEQKTVLVTGATGFVGKLLVEKILRMCNVEKVYVTMRPKRSKSVQERTDEYFDNRVYDRLKSERSEAIGKLRVVNADMSLLGLGLSEDDRKILTKEVNIVFHSAAVTKFDETLRISAHINVRGTWEILKLCTEMENLQSVVHVSTAFSFCVRSDIDEEAYEPLVKGADLLQVVGALDDSTLNQITPILLKDWPNTYSFTKSVSEGVVWGYCDRLPVAVVRPSIVSATDREPVPGWVENVMSANGVFLGTALGAIRTFQCKTDNVADLIPADHVVNCMLATATHIYKTRGKCTAKPLIYNCLSSAQSPITWDGCMSYGSRHAETVPTTMAIWLFFVVASKHRHLYLLLHFVLHMVPSYIIDFCAICVGKKPETAKQYRKMAKFLDLFAYFSTRQWTFSDKNTQELWKSLNEYDQEHYNFDAGAIDWDKYFYNFARGGRIYLLKDPLDTVPQGRAKQLKLRIAHYTLATLLITLFAYIIYVGTCLLVKFH